MLLFTLRTFYQIAAGYFKAPKVISKRVKGADGKLFVRNCAEVQFRNYPIDMDFQMHMNNSCYLRVAELMRWRMAAPSGFGGLALRKGYLFLAVEQVVTYKKPIPPMAPYKVEISCSVRDDKWIMYKHRFLKIKTESEVSESSHRSSDSFSSSKDQNQEKGAALTTDTIEDEVEYAVVDLRAVMKERNGKTVHPSKMKNASEWSKQLFSNASHDVNI